MKKITTFLGCVGVVCLFWGCSSDSNLLVPENTLSDKPALSSADNTPANISSSSVQAPASSDTGTVNPGETNPAPDPGTPTETEPVTVTKTVGKIPAEPPLGINAKGVEMTSNINQTMTKLNDVKQVSES